MDGMHEGHRHEFDYERMHTLRENIVPVKELLDILNPKKGDTIIDAGSGDGYYAIKMAQRSPDSKIIAMEISKKGNDLLRNAINTHNIKNILIEEVDLCKVKKFPDYNKVFFSTVFHDFNCQDMLIKRLKNSAMTGAKFIFFEFLKDSQYGPPAHIKLSEKELQLICERNGLKKTSENIFTDHYVQIYTIVGK